MALGIADVARARPDVEIVFSVHGNPNVARVVRSALADFDNVTITRPLSYPDFVLMMQRSYAIVSDSGGIQEEGPSLGRPVLVMRDTTERPEGIAAGVARLIGRSRISIAKDILRLLDDERLYSTMAAAVNPYGDGRAADRVLQCLRHVLYGTPRPRDFTPKKVREIR
jgi:UDP-N-acetylglucosamine 2-epimerase (non-hydrolysing)